jgi:hypothetical protein
MAAALPAQAASMNDMDHGPFVTWTIRGPETLTYKGIAIKVDEESPAAICFDTDLLRYSAAWTGGFLQWYAERDGLERHPTIEGKVQWNNAAGLGWRASGQFEDPRPIPYGPLPDEWGRYRGLYRHGDQIVLAYTVGDCDLLEHPDFQRVEGRPFFIRRFNLKATSNSLALRLGKVTGSGVAVNRQPGEARSGYVQTGSTADGW